MVAAEDRAAGAEPGPTLKERAVRGMWWSGGEIAAIKLISFVQTVILARWLLSPSDFGMFAMVGIVYVLSTEFSTLGIEQAVIQRKGEVEDVLDTAFWLIVCRNACQFLLVFLLAPLAPSLLLPVERAAQRPVLRLMLQVYSCLFLVNGFRSLGLVLLWRELEFRRRFVYYLLEALVSFALIVGLACWWRQDAWALVVGGLSTGLVTCVASYFIHPFRPAFRFSKRAAKELLSFGQHILAARAIVFGLNQGPEVFVGRFLGESYLGLFNTGSRLANLPATAINGPVERVAFPLFSKLQADREALAVAFGRILKFTALASGLAAALGITFAPDLVIVLFGQKWEAMVSAMQVLCLYGFLRSVSSLNSPFFVAVGRPQIVKLLSIAQVCLLAIAIWPLSRELGFYGTSLAITGAIVPIVPVSLVLVSKITKTEFVTLCTLILRPMAVSLVVIWFGHFLMQAVGDGVSLLWLVGLLCVCGAAYVGLALLLDRSILKEARELFA